MAEFLTKGIVATGDICSTCICFSEIEMVMINCYQTFLSSNSVCNYNTDYRPNWTPGGPITAINQKYNKILERDWFSPARFKH